MWCGMARQAPGSSKCPNPECQQSFEVDDYGVEIQYTVPVNCPNWDETWQDGARGIVECPTCKAFLRLMIVVMKLLDHLLHAQFVIERFMTLHLE